MLDICLYWYQLSGEHDLPTTIKFQNTAREEMRIYQHCASTCSAYDNRLYAYTNIRITLEGTHTDSFVIEENIKDLKCKHCSTTYN